MSQVGNEQRPLILSNKKIKEKYNRDGLKKPSVTNTPFTDEGKKVFQETISEIDKFLPKKHHD